MPLVATRANSPASGLGLSARVKFSFGFSLGGDSGGVTTSIDRLNFKTETTSTSAATLSVETAQQAGFESLTHGYAVGGTYSGVGYSNKIEKLAFSNETRTMASTTIPAGRVVAGGFASSSAGYTGGGSTGSGVYTSAIVKILFSNDSTSNLSATLAANTGWPASFEIETHGYVIAGYTGGFVSAANKIAFATDTRASLTNLSSARYAPFGFASTDAAYVTGGSISGWTIVNTIDKYLVSNDSRSTLGATLNQTKNGGDSYESNTKGYASRGGISSGRTNNIATLIFSSDTSTTLSATLATAAWEGCGFSS